MQIERAEFSKIARASVVFFIFLLAVFPISYLWIYSGLRLPHNFHLFVWFDNLLWFFPQQILPHGLYRNNPNGEETVLSAPIAMFLSVLFWCVACFLFGWLTRKLQLRFTILLAPITIFAVTFAILAVLYLFGIEIDIDGP
jgi:hypothetical protein